MATRFTQDDLDRLGRGERRPGTERISPAEARRLFSGAPAASAAPAATGSKLHNEPTVYNGHNYDSKAEAGYARKLDFRKLAGEVLRWQPHVVYELRVNGVLICSYELDFLVELASGVVEYIDVKGQRSGVPYRLFQAKKNLMLAVHGIEVQEVKG